VSAIAICVKGIFIEDNVALNLLEWIIIMREQGYSAIYMHFYTKLSFNVSIIIR